MEEYRYEGESSERSRCGGDARDSFYERKSKGKSQITMIVLGTSARKWQRKRQTDDRGSHEVFLEFRSSGRG